MLTGAQAYILLQAAVTPRQITSGLSDLAKDSVPSTRDVLNRNRSECIFSKAATHLQPSSVLG